jgi:hypothetical protein
MDIKLNAGLPLLWEKSGKQKMIRVYVMLSLSGFTRKTVPRRQFKWVFFQKTPLKNGKL